MTYYTKSDDQMRFTLLGVNLLESHVLDCDVCKWDDSDGFDLVKDEMCEKGRILTDIIQKIQYLNTFTGYGHVSPVFRS